MPGAGAAPVPPDCPDLGWSWMDGLPESVLLCRGAPTASQGAPRSCSALAVPSCHLL